MAYFSLHAYDADVWISGFAGLNQYGPGLDGDVRYAVEASNLETPAGVLQPMAAPELLQAGFQSSKIETLAHLYRRWYTGTEDKEVLFAATGGSLYYLTSTSSAWTQLPFPSGVTAYNSNVWSWVAYEINPEGSSAPVDILILSNADDGMIMVVPPYTETGTHADWTVEAIDTRADPTDPNEVPKKFGVIERYAERIWGGAIPDDPDMLVYSRPYDPTNWTPAGENEEPEDGAGSIQQPSWDGDSFTGLRQFGQQLIAFKKNRVWRILGTDPGEYTFKEQYGGGAPYWNTIAVDIERIFMVENDGMAIYDGLSVNPMQREAIEDIWRTVNKSALDQMCAAMFKQKYYVAFPTGTSAYNNALLVYNTQDNTILFYNCVNIESFLVTDKNLYATSATIPGKVLKINFDSWETGTVVAAATKWETPWMTLGRESIRKGGFDIYFTPEVKSTAATIKFTIRTEKKSKSKSYTVSPLTLSDVTAGKSFKTKRIHIGGVGRRFKLIIETAATVNVPWRLIGGIQIIAETDPD